MIVVDTNILVAFCLVSPKSALTRQLWEADSNWHAPAFWMSEFRNVLVLYRRQGIADNRACLDAMDLALETVPDANTHEPLTERVLELALVSGCSAYDCEFVAIAEELGVPLLTWDKQVVKAFPKAAYEPETFLPIP